MLRQNSNPQIMAAYNDLIKKNNEYVGYAIKGYVDQTFQKINHCVMLLQLDEQCADQVSLAFITALSALKLTLAYTQKGVIKRSTSDLFDVDPDSFKAYIEKQLPALKSLDQYVATVLGITDKKSQLINSVQNIQNAVNEYTGENKQGFITSFNVEINQFLLNAKDKTYFELRRQYHDEVPNMISRLQNNETTYYVGRFFADYRRSNSSLQPKIDKARSCFDNFKSNDVDRLLHKMQ